MHKLDSKISLSEILFKKTSSSKFFARENFFFFFFLAVDSYCECLTAGGGSVLLQKLLFYFAVLKIWVKPKAAWNADITTVHSKKKNLLILKSFT